MNKLIIRSSLLKLSHLLLNPSMKKFFIALICISTSLCTAHAQSSDDITMKKWYLDFGGSVGLFISSEQVKGQKTPVGSIALTYLQLNYKRNLFTKLQFGQTTVGFKSQSTFGTINSLVNTKANSTNLGLSMGYQRSFGKWQPFILAGSGASFIEVPATAFDTNAVNYTTSSGSYLYINAGAGINYKVSKSFILFLEGQGSTIPNLPQKSSTHLTGISALIGIKAPL